MQSASIRMKIWLPSKSRSQRRVHNPQKAEGAVGGERNRDFPSVAATAAANDEEAIPTQLYPALQEAAFETIIAEQRCGTLEDLETFFPTLTMST